MDYQKELGILTENESSMSNEFWSPEAGQHKIKIMGEMTDGTPYQEEGKEPVPRKWLTINTAGKEHTWSLPLGKTPASIYGQLCTIAVAKGNKLEGLEITIVVTGTGQNKRFTAVV